MYWQSKSNVYYQVNADSLLLTDYGKTPFYNR